VPSAVRRASTCTGIVRAASFLPWRSTVAESRQRRQLVARRLDDRPAVSPSRLLEV